MSPLIMDLETYRLICTDQVGLSNSYDTKKELAGG